MRRYQFLDKEAAYEALNNLRDAFLAAKDGAEVNKIINAVMTHDEKMKIGRRIQIAQMLETDFTQRDISRALKVGATTVALVQNLRNRSQEGYDLIEKRKEKVEREYSKRAYQKIGGSTKVFKTKKYSGFTRKT